MNRAFVLILVLLSSTLASAEIRYSITDLGILDGTLESEGMNINETGQIIGWSFMGYTQDFPRNSIFQGFYYDHGVMTNMGTFGGNFSYAYGLNNQGQAVGSADDANGNFQAFLYQNGQKTALGTMDLDMSEAHGINNSGMIVGTAWNSDSTRAFIYENGRMSDLNSRIDSNSGWTLMDARAINDSGQITGQGFYNGQIHAFFYSNGVVTDLGSTGGTWTTGFSINSFGQISGCLEGPNPNYYTQAFFWDNISGIKDLGNFGGNYAYAYAVNDLGQIVGEADDSNEGMNAFLYENNTLTNLNTLIDPAFGWSLTFAEDINNIGQIVGSGVLNGNDHAFLLTPTPEPGTLFLLVFGAGLLRWRRK